MTEDDKIVAIEKCVFTDILEQLEEMHRMLKSENICYGDYYRDDCRDNVDDDYDYVGYYFNFDNIETLDDIINKLKSNTMISFNRDKHNIRFGTDEYDEIIQTITNRFDKIIFRTMTN